MALLESKLDVAPSPLTSPADPRPLTASSPRSPARVSLLEQWLPGGITALTVDIQEQHAKVSPRTSPSRWRTPEYLVYLIGCTLATYQWLSIALRISRPSHPNYQHYAEYLSPGWMGSLLDNTDSQYRQFRKGAPALAGLASVYLLASRWHAQHYSHHPRPLSRLMFLVPVSIALCIALHGFSSLKVFTILAFNFALARTLAGQRLYVPLVWAVNIACLFLNEMNSGYRFASLYSGLSWMDGYNGLLPRWHILFNFSMLRILSFSLDYHVALRRPHNLRSPPVRPGDYSPAAFIAYTLYPPLYIAGPIMLFDEFVVQMREPPAITRRDIGRYALRLGISVVTMEWILHNIYVVVIQKAQAWHGLTPAELSMVGFFNLIIIWLKLLIPWRFFRLWAMSDGVDAPENMIRCIFNHYSTLGFWRSWHRSFNRWILKYLYLPLGGRNNSLWSTGLVFTFVAVWHDLSLNLLLWGWAISLFILPEVGARYLLPATKYGETWWYRHACAIGGVFNILTMMAANLIGFALGADGVRYLAEQIFSGWAGLKFVIVATVQLFMFCQLMFEYREEELRRGIVRKC